jgi:hypothetical protein
MLVLAGALAMCSARTTGLAFADEVRPLGELGSANTIELTGATASRQVSVPFDPDAPPLQLDALVERGVGDGVGTLEARVNDVRVALLTVDTDSPMPFNVDLRGLVPAGPEATTLDVQLTSRFQSTDAYCSGRSAVPSLRVTGLTTSFTSSDVRPESVGTFFPPLLERVELWVPAAPTATTADAVLKLTLGIVDAYRGHAVSIRVQPLPADGLPALAHETSVRHLVIGDAKVSAVTLRDAPAPAAGLPARVLALPAERLVTASLGLLQDITELAVGPAASYQQRAGDAVVPPLEQRLIDLGAPIAMVTGQGQVGVDLSVPQAAFGGMVTSYDLRLDGRVLADRKVVVSVLVNNELVDAHRTTGTFNRRIHISAPPLTRATSIRVEVNEVGDDGRCTGRDDPVALQLADTSSLAATLGVTPRVSFQLLPQALLPVLDVAFSAFTPATIDAGAALVADLAAGVPRGLGIRIVPSLDDIVESERPGLVVWAGPPEDLRDAGLRVVPDAPATALNLEDRDGRLPDGVPVAQIARVEGRHVLVVTALDDSTLRDFAHQLVDFPNDLNRFDGDVVVADGGRLRDVQLTVIPEPELEREHELAGPAKAWLAIGAVAVGILGLSFALRAVRGRRRSSQDQ